MLTGSDAKKGRPAAESAGEAAGEAPAPERTRRAFIHRTKPKAGAEPGRSAENGNGKLRSRLTADDLARQQREISVSEFFTKNRHLLGFDNPTKALLTTVKEAVDNSLDACEEAGMLPDVAIEIKALEEEDRFRVTVRDNGPGIVPKQVPQIFGQLLYGSKFHRLKMSRGQQGIGISAAGMYGLLTTGRPVKVISRPGDGHRAKYYELQIDTKRNQPVLHKEEFVDWRPGSGTEVSIDLVAKYIRGRRSVEEYLESTAIANPHVRMEYSGPGGEKAVYPRASKVLPPEPREIKPHPHGVELGLLIKMLQETSSHTLAGFLKAEFCRVSDKVAKELCAAAKLYERARPKRIARDEIDKLYKAIGAAKLMNPPTDCLAPIGEDGLVAGLQKQIKADFYTAVTRRPAVYRGNPFLVECAVAYGGELPEEDLGRVIRFANRVPLLYQQGSCAITEAVMDTDWRNYRLSQSRGALPTGPLVITVHFASVWVPFTSESKEAVAHYPEVIHEIKLALQECGRRLSLFIGRRRRAAEAERKISHINRYVPHIAIGLREMLGLTQRQEQNIVSKLKAMLEKTRGVTIPDA